MSECTSEIAFEEKEKEKAVRFHYVEGWSSLRPGGVAGQYFLLLPPSQQNERLSTRTPPPLFYKYPLWPPFTSCSKNPPQFMLSCQLFGSPGRIRPNSFRPSSHLKGSVSKRGVTVTVLPLLLTLSHLKLLSYCLFSRTLFYNKRIRFVNRLRVVFITA